MSEAGLWFRAGPAVGVDVGEAAAKGTVGEMLCTDAVGGDDGDGGEGLELAKLIMVGLRPLDTRVSRATSVATATTIPRKANRNRVRGCLAHLI